MSRARFLFWLDVLLLLAVALLQEPRRTSLAGHEWLGVGFAVVLALHLLVNWRWIVMTLARVRAGESRRARVNASLNATLFVLMAVTVFSGLVVSEIVLPLTGLVPSGLSAWRQIHGFVSGLVLVVVGLHVALNWDWIAGVVRTGALWRPRRGATVPFSPELLSGDGGRDA